MTTEFAQDIGEGGDFMTAWQALTFGGPSYTPKALPAPTPVPAIPARSGSSARIDKGTPGGGSGSIAGPLSEVAYSERTFHPQRTTTTPDGLLSVAWTPLKSMRLLDANAAEVVFNFKAPA